MILSLFSLCLNSFLESCRYRSILYLPVTPEGISGFTRCPDVVLICSKNRVLVSDKGHTCISQSSRNV